MKPAILLGSLLALAGCSSAPSKPDPVALAVTLDKILQTAVEQKKVPGVVAMVATTDGVVYEGTASMSKDAICAIASMTKPVTSVAVMQLVEAGKVKVDGPASTYVSELAQTQVLENGKLRAARTPITVRHLLTHTAGFTYEFMSPEIFELVKSGKVASMMAGGDAFLRAPLLFEPGQRWEYGISIDWLGRLVEKVSGQKLDEYFQTHIFQPLGMQDSFFHVPAEKKARMVKLHQRKEDGSLVEQPAPAAIGGTFLSGGGGLYSTASDYLRFTQAILNGGEFGGKRILKSETLALMGQNQIGALSITPLRSMAPQFAKDNAVLPGGLDKFGFGFAMNSKAIEKGRGANTLAWVGIFNTFFWVDREKKVTAVFLSQMSPGMDEGPAQAMEEFERAVYAWLEHHL